MCNPAVLFYLGQNVAMTTLQYFYGTQRPHLSFLWLVGHEIGHNWGGFHDFQFPSWNCTHGIMSYDPSEPLVTIILYYVTLRGVHQLVPLV